MANRQAAVKTTAPSGVHLRDDDGETLCGAPVGADAVTRQELLEQRFPPPVCQDCLYVAWKIKSKGFKKVSG
jgi:hypothetical protein